MDTGFFPGNLLELLGTGLSAISWSPREVAKTEWVYANAARCRLTGHSKDELLGIPPFNVTTRETRSQLPRVFSQLKTRGRASLETTLVHKSGRVLPVRMDIHLAKEANSEFLLIEHHDISLLKRLEDRQSRTRENTREMLMLIEEEKMHLARNMEGNLGVVALPLIGQLRVNASKSQKIILELLETRLKHATKDLGIPLRPDSRISDLTRRQKMICEMIGQGMTSKEIAMALDTALSTIHNHRNTIRKKLGISGKPANLQTYLNQSP